ncbi:MULTISPECIES: hypothetical protein [unclassified Romboutsia]|uniref:hypothetical protein n=1 Tax=unclassified Romboutsia TaxID=2626894 RepID=UPI000821A910|nr:MULTISPECIES: hypothetical protein [unclassified Romboutsia]SCI03467.1 Uncharacterised protein [uncultured Clostridium sp.]
MDSPYIKTIYNKIEFLEFKQNILFLKQPQHKASVFCELTLEDFLKIKDFTDSFSKKVLNNEILTFSSYEDELFEILPLLKSYPSSSKLVAKALMDEDIFNKLFQYDN